MSGDPVRIVIVDDEPLARERLRSLLADEPGVEIVAECSGGADAVERIRRVRPDLLFLDVQMPEIDGFDVLQALDEATLPLTIFVTAHDEHAVRAFEVHAIDYLLKPFDRERFSRALDRARSEIALRRGQHRDERLLGLLEDLRSTAGDRLVIRAGGRVVFLRTGEIDWIEAAGNYLQLHCGDEEHLMRETMAGMEQRLGPDRFARVHRSTIVNLERVRELQTPAGGEATVVLTDGTRLGLSRRYREAIEQRLQIDGNRSSR